MILPIKYKDKKHVPTRAHADDAGYDLTAAITNPVTIFPGSRRAIPLGFSISLEPGTAMLILPRSGLALNKGITVLNAPGLIDPGYTGEVTAILANTDDQEPFVVEPGARVAQGVIIRVERPEFRHYGGGDFSFTERGKNGFGSTGC